MVQVQQGLHRQPEELPVATQQSAAEPNEVQPESHGLVHHSEDQQAELRPEQSWGQVASAPIQARLSSGLSSPKAEQVEHLPALKHLQLVSAA